MQISLFYINAHSVFWK